MMLIVEKISKKFNGLNVLDSVSFKYSGEGILGIGGPNGSGKTTLLNILSGNVLPDKGRIIFNGTILTRYPLHKMAQFGLVRTYQEGKVFPSHTPMEHLILVKTIEKNSIDITEIEKLLCRVGLKEKIHSRASTLSFGQIRRLQIAMALFRTNSKLFLFDEPSSGTDPGFIEDLKDILMDLRVKRKGVIVVEHNLELINQVADNLMILENGKILAVASPKEVLQCHEVQNAYLGGIYAS
jgi:ABC-type branched-subunit amino acid transport system ATPase component